MHTRFLVLVLFTTIALSAHPSLSQQVPTKAKPAPPKRNGIVLEDTSSYYRVVGLGSSKGDTSNGFPFPTALLQVFDTARTLVAVRFPELGMLGVREDTATEPAFLIGDSLRGYQPHEPLLHLTFPKTEYFVFIDVWSRDHKTLLESRPFEYDMDARKYHAAHLRFDHEATVGPGAPTLRRTFKPALLPFSIEANPAWNATETLDSSGTYSLVFRDPERSNHSVMTLSMRPALVGLVDSTMWKNFRLEAEMAFGAKGVATSPIGDFQVDDTATRVYIKGGYEFASKRGESTVTYVATYATPHAVLMLSAPFDQPNQQLQYEYFRAVARSLKQE